MERIPVVDHRVRLLPTDPRDMVPGAVGWARAVLVQVASVPAEELHPPLRDALEAVVWVLAAAADYALVIPADHTARMLAEEAGVGYPVWQKRSAWLRGRGWLRHGPGGPRDGWVLVQPA